MSEQKITGSPRLVWVVPHSLTQTLYATARREPARALQALGWRVLLVGAGAGGRRTLNGVPVEEIHTPNVYFLRQLLFHLQAARLLLREGQDVDVVLFHQISAVWLLLVRGWRRLSGHKRPLFILDTRDMPDFVPGSLKLWLRQRYYDLIYWLCRRWADGQTAITRRMAEFAQIPQEQLLGIWPSGVVLETFAPAQQARRWPADDEPVHLIYIGSLIAKRNLLPLCTAVQQANREKMAFRLTLIGSGEHQRDLQAAAAQSNGRIQVLPPVAHDEVPARLAQAHIGVTSLPHPHEAKYEASSPIKLFEYLAAGLPILSVRSACHTDVIGAGQFAFWVNEATQDELHAALRQIWRQREALPTHGAQAAQTAQAWTWQASGQKLSSALLRGLNGTRLMSDQLQKEGSF